ncbi:unnamed protein product [Prunus armeniaca]|uniref:Uncharacterized protein n=1 Tax=Prunus armeniaca TaxID=36596 RepID=A0A6J5V300_PRUAR|nr:unnamed protein product [Prunus armeniaca]
MPPLRCPSGPVVSLCRLQVRYGGRLGPPLGNCPLMCLHTWVKSDISVLLQRGYQQEPDHEAHHAPCTISVPGRKRRLEKEICLFNSLPSAVCFLVVNMGQGFALLP